MNASAQSFELHAPKRILERTLHALCLQIFCLSFGPKSFVVISDPEYAKQILLTNANKYSKGLLSEILVRVRKRADVCICAARARACVCLCLCACVCVL